MAKVKKIDEAAWRAWVASRPKNVQKLCTKFPPDRLYRLKPGSHRVTLYSYCEDGTMTVSVSGKYNAIAFARQVFGVKPEDLEECDVPVPGEQLGEMLTDPKAVEAFCAEMRKS